jgi:hypothetical protein
VLLPIAIALPAIVVLVAIEVVVIRWWSHYMVPAQYEDVAKRYGLIRRRWEHIDAWEKRIFQATEDESTAASALVEEAQARGTFSFFEPYKRPPMPKGLTWTTGIGFFGGGLMAPYIAWLPDEHPLAKRLRTTRALDRS